MFSTVQQSIVEQQGVKKRKMCNVNTTQHPRRILSRRYPLTKTCSKYLDIGINVSTPSYVEIALGDNRGIEIQFTYNVWKAILHQRNTIQQYFFNDVKDEVRAPKNIGNITLSFGKINNEIKIMRLETPTFYIVMSSNTVCNMMAHEYCVDRIVQALDVITSTVDVKITRLREIVNGATDPVAIHAAIRESESFDETDIIDCELLAQIFAMR